MSRGDGHNPSAVVLPASSHVCGTEPGVQRQSRASFIARLSFHRDLSRVWE